MAVSVTEVGINLAAQSIVLVDIAPKQGQQSLLWEEDVTEMVIVITGMLFVRVALDNLTLGHAQVHAQQNTLMVNIVTIMILTHVKLEIVNAEYAVTGTQKD